MQNLDDIKRGPQFITEPLNTIIVGATPNVYLECVATGNPQPTLKWFHGQNLDEIVESSDRYTVTNGRILMTDPAERFDAGKYRCEAANDFGTIISEPVQLSFGCKYMPFIKHLYK